MFVDELHIYAKAGKGGDGVVRWLRERNRAKGGPAGGNGGNGGDVYVRAVRDLNLLSKYTGAKEFRALDGESGRGKSQYGKGSNDLYIDVPIGSVVTDEKRNRVYELFKEGQVKKILLGGQGGLGNEYFKSSTNRTPEKSTKGQSGESGTFFIELSLVVDVGLIGMPNAGKSTLLNEFTNATSEVAAYPFTTLEPHLGDLYGYVLADIPCLVSGAAKGKGLGHKFLRHITLTKMLLHLVSLDSDDPISDYNTIRNELANYGNALTEREEWIIFTKTDLVNKAKLKEVLGNLDTTKKHVFAISVKDGLGVKVLQDALVEQLRKW